MSNYPQVACIADGSVFLKNAFTTADIAIQEDTISNFAGIGVTVHAHDCYVIPGLIDIHFHGAVGADLSDGNVQAIHSIAAYEASQGVTSMCPATMTLPYEQLAQCMQAASVFSPAINEASLVGINIEGPFISPSKLGAQNAAYVRNPSVEEFNALNLASGNLIKLVDIAPEQPGADSFIHALHDKVRISIAHTCATYEQAKAAFALGAKHVTHLYNAMNPLHHREPGPIPAAVENQQVTAEVITDGVHIHPAMVRLAFQLFGKDRIIFISDSLRAAGMPDGSYQLGGQLATVKDGQARLQNGALAGSACNLLKCLQCAVTSMGIPIEAAVQAATYNPARAIGVHDTVGSLQQGLRADVVLLDKQTLQLRHVIVRGKLIV